MGSPNTVTIVLLVCVFVLGIYVTGISAQLKQANAKIDLVLSNFDGLRDYLYEIDTQFDDERESDKDMEDDSNSMAAYHDFQLLDSKEKSGRRTLNTPFVKLVA
jgi:hypothetical protein